MNTQETIANNRLIAEFMGAWWETREQPIPYWENLEGAGPYPTDKDLKYYEDWNWLMPVVEEIENLNSGGYDFGIFPNSTIIYKTRSDSGELDCETPIITINCSEGYDFDQKIGFTYEAVVQFIKWHNENKEA